jgi:hypothetical protein
MVFLSKVIRELFPLMSDSFPKVPAFKPNGLKITARYGVADTISRSIAEASPHSTVAIPTGIYHESLVIDKEIILQPSDPSSGEVVIIPPPGKCALTLSSPHVIIRHFIIQLRDQMPGKTQRLVQGSYPVDFQSGIAEFEHCGITSPLFLRSRPIRKAGAILKNAF